MINPTRKRLVEAFNDPENLENVVNPANRRKQKKTAKKVITTTPATTENKNYTQHDTSPPSIPQHTPPVSPHPLLFIFVYHTLTTPSMYVVF
jgi:hypothetical protein